MSLLKLPLLLAGAISIWMALTPPHTPAKPEKLPPTFVGRFAKIFVTSMKIAHALSCLCESLIILSKHGKFVNPTVVRYFAYTTPSSQCINGTGITRSFLFGSFVAIAGSQLRLACYRILGSYFTFELAIRSNHKLITRGPYSYVRHPAYTGLIMTMLGEAIIQFGNGSWLRECGWTSFAGIRVYAIILLVQIGSISFSVATKRARNEDKALRERFGEEWQAWARNTPYLLIPYIY
ncbi:hypothetical protein F5878DRAFT_66712 [Lentinula raphanica]|uniref:Protein-S-isoprenylcysteine O-methyltransferase n=1 Tax=Lentinula raphanica TaxID=153919 RepID=A0AA38UG51_9AGAR|nr:hypothetical protein F5880DRAFT_230021 [Lentinula raphanica]KAJ3840537.1 hypothetical protein F5878DRAFT_66712 [Lentinula raphanica]